MLSDGTMVMGSPGLFTWRGAIFLTATAGSYLRRDKTLYYSPHLDAVSPVDKYSYLGMAVTGGKYYGDSYSFASGAPRAEGVGQVVIFSKNNSNPMLVTQIINGTQFGSNFGYELATADVNGDGLADLIVAAPFYFEKNKGGAVYVYQNKGYSLPAVPTTNLTGKFESRFGYALANLGDLNRDGFEDVAIGAPFEGSGVVYIYLGSKNGLSKEPAQVITVSNLGSRNVPTTLKTFGSSISGGQDLDGNQYPDILIGAYASDAVISLLARPIINIKTEIHDTALKNIAAEVKGCPNDPNSNLTCFSFEACCAIQPFDSRTRQLDLIYVIEAETYNGLKRFSRVFFAPYFESKEHYIRKSIKVTIDGTLNCHQETVYIKENTRDIQSPIKFRLNYTIVESRLPSNALEQLNPILDKMQADRTFDATFAKDCGTNDICESKLDVIAGLELERTQSGDYALILGRVKEIQLTASVTNEEDSAYEAHLFIVHDPKLVFIAIGKEQKTVACISFNETVVDCFLGNPMKRDTVLSVTVRFEPSALDDVDSALDFRVFANTTSSLIDPKPDIVLHAKIVKRAEVSILGTGRPEQVFYGKEALLESEVKYLDDIGTPVHHFYEIYNEGPWKATYMEVLISWPHQIWSDDEQEGKGLLYLEEMPSIENSGGGICVIDNTSYINPLKLDRRKLIDQELVPESLMLRPHNKTNPKHSPYKENPLPDTDDLLSSSTTYSPSKQSSSSTSSVLNRLRRDLENIIAPERLVDQEGRKYDVVTMVSFPNLLTHVSEIILKFLFIFLGL